MLYSPALSKEMVCTLRRMAWQANKPMTKVLEEALVAKSKKIVRRDACYACKDKSKCNLCLFDKRH